MSFSKPSQVPASKESPGKPSEYSRFRAFDHQRSLLLNTSGETETQGPTNYFTDIQPSPKHWLFRTKRDPHGCRSIEREIPLRRNTALSILDKANSKVKFNLKRNCRSLERRRTEPAPPRDQEKVVFGIRTRRGYDPNNCFKKNQDAYLASSCLLRGKPMHLFGVCDGHGKDGEKVSDFIVANFPAQLAAVLKDFDSISFRGGPTEGCSGGQSSGLETLMYQALKNTHRLLNQADFDYMYSGATLNVILVWDSVVYSCNVGDSRVILLKDDLIVQLSEDHKPENPNERIRIEEKNGVIGRSLDEHGHEAGPLRVWAKGEDLPGLSLSRSLGDQAFESIGITWKPSFTIHRLENSRQLIFVVGSDGLFEVLSNLEVMRVLEPFWAARNVEDACDALMEVALARWKEGDFHSIDDITFVVVFMG